MTDGPPIGATSASELKAQIEMEREGVPFLVWRDGGGEQRILPLADTVQRVSVGRDEATDVALEWDTEVSRVHAELERIGSDWAITDDGLSRNGTFLNGARISGRRRLRDRDALRFGRTPMVFRHPLQSEAGLTQKAPETVDATAISETQRRVLVALCRPFKDPTPYTTAPTNQQLADELFLSVEAVKAHLRVLFAKFEVDGLPQNQKRLKLVHRALESGVVTHREL
jgi:pSer/pThr/pTyr-binding forkhead associated (FHA) protein